MGTTRRARRVIAAATLAAVWTGASAAAGAAPASRVQAAGDPVSISVSQATGLREFQVVQVTVDGAATEGVEVTQCQGPWPDHCAVASARVPPGTERPYTVDVPVYALLAPPVGGVRLCGACSLTAVAWGEFDVVSTDSVPIEVLPVAPRLEFLERPPPDLSTGDVVRPTLYGNRTVETGYALCHESVLGSRDVFGGPCTAPQVLPPADEARTIGVTVASSFTGNDGSDVRCRRYDCVVALASADGATFAATVPLRFAYPGGLAVEPRTGLVDGQAVGVTAVDVPPSYAGDPFWVFPETGTWVAAQCASRVADEPSIYAVFRDCAAVPGVGEVDVPSNEVGLGPFPVQASLTTILGEEVDCTASPGACVLALVRVEADGAASAVTEPLAFA